MTLYRGKECVQDDCGWAYDTLFSMYDISHQDASGRSAWNLVLPTPDLTRFDDALEFVSRCLNGDLC